MRFDISKHRRRARLRTIAIIFATALVVAPGAALASNSFSDVGSGEFFHGAVDWAKTNGVTVGCNPPDNTKFCPNDFVTRGQMAVFLQRLDTEDVFLRPGDVPMSSGGGDADTLDGKDSTAFLLKTQKAADADKLDGLDSTAFLSSAPGSVGTSNFATLPAARVTGADSFTTGGGDKTIEFDTVAYDTASMFDPASPDELTAPIDGLYRIQAGIRWSSNASGLRGLYIQAAGDQVSLVEQNASSGSDGQNVGATIELAAGDTVQAWVYQSSGSTLSTTRRYTFLELVWVGPGS